MSPETALPRPLAPFTVALRGAQLVEASAGTGKTYTLGSLVLRLLLEEPEPGQRPPTISEILVVTFTHAATSELRERIRARLAGAMAQLDGTVVDDADADFTAWLVRLATPDPNAIRARLRDALRNFDDAAIFTIHGFCQRILREYAFESGVDFEAELVGDESALRRMCIDDYWARVTYGAPPYAVAWLRQEAGLKVETMERLGDMLAAAPHLDRLPPADDNGPDAVALADGQTLVTAAWSAAADAWGRDGRTALEQLARAAEDGHLHGGTYKPEAIRRSWGHTLDTLFAAPPTWPDDKARALLTKLSTGEMRVNKSGTPPAHPFFDACANLTASLGEIADQLDAWGLAVRHDLDEWLKRELPERKRRARQLSFDDLLFQLHHALTDDPEAAARLAGRIRGRYRAALIDEFQDTDLVQYEIFQRIFAPREQDITPPFVLIGDPKQAIYAFRGADVFAYLQAVKDVGAGRQHTLTVNYRADQAMVDALNAWCEGPVRPFLFDGIPYIPVQARHPDRLIPADPPLELAYIPAGVADRDHGDKPAKVDAARRAAARAAATAIGRLLAEPPRIKQVDGTTQSVTAGDVAVLVRTNSQSRLMRRVLRDHGIPSVLYSDASVLDQPEADVLRQLLAAVVDPADARRVRAALTTAAVGLDAAAIDGLAQDERGWEEWVERFRAWQDLWRRTGFLPAVRQMLDTCDAPRQLLMLPDGERRLTNLLHLAELLHGVAAQLDLGPEGLLAWFDRVRDDPDLRQRVLGDTAQLRLDSDAAAVKIVTVHKSKGLEYPIVYCPFLWSGPPGRKDPALRFHDLDHDRRQYLDIGAKADEASQRAAFLESVAEDLRLLYVALTRARHRCWVALGAFNNSDDGALAYALHAPEVASEAPADDRVDTLDAWQKAVAKAAKTALTAAGRADIPDTDPLWRRIHDIADAHPATIRAVRLTMADVQASRVGPAPVDRPAAEPVSAAVDIPRPRRPRRVLFRSSFTALARSEPGQPPAEVDDGVDHDAPMVDVGVIGADDAHDAARVAGTERVPLADLVAGQRLGTGLHALLERIDFTDDGRWQAQAAELAERRALPAEAVEPLRAALRTVLGTPLGDGALAFTLSDVPRADRINELGYVLPVAVGAVEGRFAPVSTPVGPADLARVMAAHPGGALPPDYPARLAALPAQPFAGWLSGSLDLVFRRQSADGSPCWYLVDWKSNRLGTTWDDYAPDRLVAAMAHHHYFLQSHLYAVALHRYLGQRQQDYDPARHFGGILYVFIRGMRTDQPGSGVLFDRPPAARIAALDALLGQVAR